MRKAAAKYAFLLHQTRNFLNIDISMNGFKFNIQIHLSNCFVISTELLLSIIKLELIVRMRSWQRVSKLVYAYLHNDVNDKVETRERACAQRNTIC